MSFTRFYLIRHGETFANLGYRYVGARDDMLSPMGEQQAVLLGDTLRAQRLAAIYSSPLRRAYRTAEVIAMYHSKLRVEMKDELREMSFGTWEGLNRAEVLARSPEDGERLGEWEKDASVAPPEGESFVATQERVSKLAQQLAQQHPDQEIVLVSHVGPIKALLASAMGVSISSALRIILDPATINVIDWSADGLASVRLVNSHAHLGWKNARWMQKES